MDQNLKQNSINFKTNDISTKNELSVYIAYLKKLEELILFMKNG